MILLVGLLLPLWAQETSLAGLQHEPSRVGFLQLCLNNILRWKADWHGGDAFPSGYGYRPGRQVPVSVVYSPSEIALILEGVGFSLRLRQDSDGAGVLSRFGEFTARESGEEMVARYVRSLRPGLECGAAVTRERTGKRGPGDSVPTTRACTAVSGTIEVYVEELLLTLPNLRAGTGKRVAPPGHLLRTAEQMIEKVLIEFGGSNCSRRSGIIPYFSRYDPVVYVLMEGCGKLAVQEIHPDVSGGWELGKLTVNARPNDLSALASRIRARALRKVWR